MKEDIAQKTLNLALKYADEAEVYLENEEIIDVNIQNQRVDFAKETTSYGLGLRVIKDNKMGFAHTTDISSLEKTVENAVYNARCNESDKNFCLAHKSKYPQITDVYDKRISQLGIEETIDFAKTMIQTALDERCQPTSGGASAGCFKTIITNSEGVYSEDTSTYFSGYISVNIPDGEGVSTANESDASRFFDIKPDEISRKACKWARDSRGGKSVETADLNVLLDYDAAASLIHTMANAFNADNVQRGRSIYADKVGTQVLSPYLNIYDDGTLKKGLNSSTTDGEGVPSQKTILVEDGILKSFIYDLYTSRKSEVQSTGNGIRSSFADTPSVGFSNVIMDFAELKELSEIKNGVVVKDLLGAHTANPISGDFSVEAMNAFKIDNGEISHPIKKAMLSGNIFESFQEAWAASAKTRQIGPFVLTPIILSKLRIVG